MAHNCHTIDELVIRFQTCTNLPQFPTLFHSVGEKFALSRLCILKSRVLAFSRKKKVFASNSTEDVDEREFLGGFCLLFTKVAHLLLQQMLSCSLKERKRKEKEKSILKNLIDLQSMHPRYLEIVIRSNALKGAYSL